MLCLCCKISYCPFKYQFGRLHHLQGFYLETSHLTKKKGVKILYVVKDMISTFMHACNLSNITYFTMVTAVI